MDESAGSPERFGYEWAKYNELRPDYEIQFRRWTPFFQPDDWRGKSVLDVGCGNGSLTARLADAGFRAVGLEHAETGVQQAAKAFTQVEFRAHDINNPLPTDLRGRFDVVMAAEVIEHLYLPRQLFARAREALAPGGLLLVTTPYHGYLKNLAIAVAGKFDHHWRPSWDHGHIKFFSRTTLSDMAVECGFRPVGFSRVGRIAPLAKSMILTAKLV